jgi:hypothetical protein
MGSTEHNPTYVPNFARAQHVIDHDHFIISQNLLPEIQVVVTFTVTVTVIVTVAVTVTAVKIQGMRARTH